MKRVGRTLVLEDDPDWQNLLGRNLREAGFHVDIATSVSDALALVKDSFYHLAVLDVSMVKGSATDREGMQLLADWHAEGLHPTIEVVMISGYGTNTILREAFGSYKASDFYDKLNFDSGEFVRKIGEIISRNVNLDLDIQWDTPSQREQVVLNIEIDGERVKRDTPLQERTANELEDLLCRLFPDAISLLVKPLTPGTSGSTVLHATRFRKDGGAQPVVVKVGAFKRIKKEFDSFETHAQPFIRGRSTSIIKQGQTTHLGGLIYSLVGGSGDKIESFGSYYAHADVPRIQGTLTHLVRETCGAWYANPGNLQLCNLTEQYREKLGLTDENLAQGFAQLKGVQGKRQLYFDSLTGRAFTNPIMASGDRQFRKSTYVCNTHGDLNSDNILVDLTDHAWLIDFEHTGPGHILRDIAELDLVVRAQLLLAEEASLTERLQLEEMLLQAQTLGEVEQLRGHLQTENPALSKAYEITVHLRALAADMLSKNPNADLDEYYIALLYYSLNALRFLSWRGIQRQHALLSACLIADQLEL